MIPVMVNTTPRCVRCSVPLPSNSSVTVRIPSGLNSSRHANASVCSGPPVMSISIVLEEEGGRELRVFWNTSAESPYPVGTRLSYTARSLEPQIVERIDKTESGRGMHA